MKHKIYYSPESLHDLDEIHNYFFSELFCSGAAAHTVNKIITAIDTLEHFPQIGPLLSSIYDIQSEYHFLVRGNYMIFYRIQNCGVYIDRILHKKRDYLHILFQSHPQSEE